MGWRNVMIPARPSRGGSIFTGYRAGTDGIRSLEDIAVIVLNHREINLTHPVLSACAEYGIGFIPLVTTTNPAASSCPSGALPTTRMMRRQLDVARLSPSRFGPTSSGVRSRIRRLAFNFRSEKALTAWNLRPARLFR
ncbi:MAG: hypothetical protein IPL05_06905 [Betaproteobacteria bacterium]|nr:hypothetical protein [Betaproteobacteria bacterium]